MARRPYAALGMFSTPHGTVIIRRLFARKQRSWVLILDGAHAALRTLLPDWRPRSPSTRTSLTPPTTITTRSGIAAFYQTLMPVWLARATQETATTTPVASYRTFGALIQVVDEEAAVALRAGSLATYRHQWAVWLHRLPATTPLNHITRQRLQAMMGELGMTYASTTVRNLRAALSKLLLRAVEDGALARNPLIKVRTPTPIVRPRSYLTQTQRDAVLHEAEQRDAHVYRLFALLFFLGLRKSEALALTWNHVDLPGRVVHITNSATFTTKNGQRRTVPMNDSLAALLAAHRQRTGFVLQPTKSVRHGRYRWNFARVFDSVVRAAGVPWLTPHGCRHAFASLFLAGGGSFFKLSRYLGHSISETTELYAHHAPGYDSDINCLTSPGSASVRRRA